MDFLNHFSNLQKAAEQEAVDSGVQNNCTDRAKSEVSNLCHLAKTQKIQSVSCMVAQYFQITLLILDNI